MRTFIYSMVLLVWSLGTNAQEKSFRNFKVLPFFFYEVYVVPSDFEGMLDTVKREIREKELLVSVSEQDSLVAWLKCVSGKWKESVSEEERLKEWEPLMPATMKKRLQKASKQYKGRERRYFSIPYFSFNVFANDRGEVLSAYFWMKREMLEVVNEEDLQAMCDAAVGKRIDTAMFDFSHYTRELADEIKQRVADRQDKKEPIKLEKTERKSISHGLLQCFSLEYQCRSPKPGKRDMSAIRYCGTNKSDEEK